MMDVKELRQEYCKEEAYKKFNNMNLNQYTLWLEEKIISLTESAPKEEESMKRIHDSPTEWRDVYFDE